MSVQFQVSCCAASNEFSTLFNVNRSKSLELSVKAWKAAWFDYLCTLGEKKLTVKLILHSITFTLFTIKHSPLSL